MDDPERPQRDQRPPGTEPADIQFDGRFASDRLSSAGRQLQDRQDLCDERSECGSSESPGSDSNRDSYADPDPDADTDSNSDSDADTHSDSNPDTNSNAQPDSFFRSFLFDACGPGPKLLCFAGGEWHNVFI